MCTTMSTTTCAMFITTTTATTTNSVSLKYDRRYRAARDKHNRTTHGESFPKESGFGCEGGTVRVWDMGRGDLGRVRVYGVVKKSGK